MSMPINRGQSPSPVQTSQSNDARGTFSENNLTYNLEYDSKKGLLNVSYFSGSTEGKFTIRMSKEFMAELSRKADQNQSSQISSFEPLVKNAVKVQERLINLNKGKSELTFTNHKVTIKRPEPGLLNFFRRLLGLGGYKQPETVNLLPPDFGSLNGSKQPDVSIKFLEETHLFLKANPNGLSPKARLELLTAINQAYENTPNIRIKINGEKVALNSGKFRESFNITQEQTPWGSQFIDNTLKSHQNDVRENLVNLAAQAQDGSDGALYLLYQAAKSGTANVKNDAIFMLFQVAKSSSNNPQIEGKALIALSKFENRPEVKAFVENKISELKNRANSKDPLSALKALITLSVLENRPEVNEFIGVRIKELNKDASSNDALKSSSALKILSLVAACDGAYVGTLDENRNPHGLGILTLPDGKVLEGYFIHGRVEAPLENSEYKILTHNYKGTEISSLLRTYFKAVRTQLSDSSEGKVIDGDEVQILTEDLNKHMTKTNEATGNLKQYDIDFKRIPSLLFIDGEIEESTNKENGEPITKITSKDENWKPLLQVLCTQRPLTINLGVPIVALKQSINDYLFEPITETMKPKITINRDDNGKIQSVTYEEDCYTDAVVQTDARPPVKILKIEKAVRSKLSFTAKLDDEGKLVISDYRQSSAYNFLGDSSVSDSEKILETT